MQGLLLGQVARRRRALFSIVLNLKQCRPTQAKQRIKEAIGKLRAYGATAVYDGAMLGFDSIRQGRGERKALIFEGDRWDPSKNEGRGGPVTEQHFSYRELLFETALRARVLSNLGLKTGDRIALNMPNIPEQIFYILAAQRLGHLTNSGRSAVLLTGRSRHH